MQTMHVVTQAEGDLGVVIVFALIEQAIVVQTDQDNHGQLSTSSTKIEPDPAPRFHSRNVSSFLHLIPHTRYVWVLR